jgi:hypothetical protein
MLAFEAELRGVRAIVERGSQKLPDFLLRAQGVENLEL